MKRSDGSVFNLVIRTRITIVCLLLGFFILCLRLWFLQVLHNDYYRVRSDNNRFREIPLVPPRGEIYDRNGNLLVENRPAYHIELVKEDCAKVGCEKTLEKLAEIIGKDIEELKKSVASPQLKRRRFQPRVIISDVDRDTVAKVLTRKYELPGILINVEPARHYIYNDWASHILGYIGEISPEQLESPNFSGYRAGDVVGKFGVESVQEPLLQGQRGKKIIIVNAAGTRLKDADYEGEKPGHNVTLTIDYVTQQAAEEAMSELRGAAVALDPQTGEVLAMVSKPSFDPNRFVSGLSADYWAELNGEGHAMSNRVLQGLYPLGSVFKTFMGVAGLAEGVIKSTEVINCAGSFQVGNSRPFTCHGHHGPMDLKAALKKSCNIYFYTVGQRLGIERIHDYATRFGFGEKTGLDLANEKEGLIPSIAWKRKRFNDKWYPGETPSVSIGQGAIEVTPLQVARAMAALVNGGRVLKPYLVKQVELQDGTHHFEGRVEEQRTLGIEPWILDYVKEALVGVVNETGGTGNRSNLNEFGIEVGGKTGTAQTRQMRGSKTLKEEYSLAWFGGFAPAKNPRIVVAVVVEKGGHGGVTAAPVAKKIMQAYLVHELPAKVDDDSTVQEDFSHRVE